jgi:predicted nuclease of predicted toxin-antitoxin system
MLRLLADENLNGDILRGLRLRKPTLDIVRVQDEGLSAADDPAILRWAAENDRIVVTHDRATLPDFAYERIIAREAMPGIFVLSDRFPVGRAIEEILLLDECSDQREWDGVVAYLPV